MQRNQELAGTRKRKRAIQQTYDVKRQRLSCNDNEADEPLVKRRHSDDILDQVGVHNPVVEQKDLVEHWVGNECKWSSFLKETTTMDDRQSIRSQKRSLSRSNSYSYRQSTISGDTPKAWGAKHAGMMLENGIFMDRQEGATITQDDEVLCKKILEARHDLPEEWRFQNENFLLLVKMALYKNEQRVKRDVGPHIMPSPELLSAQGHAGIEHVAEGVDAQWSKCTSLCGPKSRPDVSHGLSRFVFTALEREKLTSNNTAACETMMFPFYICEAKCFDKSIEESELQAMHSASVAGNTVIELYQKISAAEELDRRILAFSVSHNQRLVKIFGHFALIDGSKITFHRHRLFETDLMDDVTSRTRPYQIALGIWKHFYPIHLARVQDALARQQSRAIESFTTQLGLEEDLRSGSSTPVSLPDDSQTIIKLQEDNAKLLNRLLEEQEESRRQVERQSEQHREQQQESRRQRMQLERQVERLSEQTERQSEQHREQMERQSEQHREQMERQSEQHREQMERQSEQHREQMKQQKEIITLIKQSKP